MNDKSSTISSEGVVLIFLDEEEAAQEEEVHVWQLLEIIERILMSIQNILHKSI